MFKAFGVVIVRYKVVFNHGKDTLTAIVTDEEGMNEDEIVTEAQVILQRRGVQIDFEQIELVSCEILND